MVVVFQYSHTISGISFSLMAYLTLSGLPSCSHTAPSPTWKILTYNTTSLVVSKIPISDILAHMILISRMLHHKPQTTETMHLSWANLPNLKSSKNYLVYNRIRCLPYLAVNSVIWVSVFVYWLLPSSGQAWPLLDIIGYQNYNIWSYQNVYQDNA